MQLVVIGMVTRDVYKVNVQQKSNTLYRNQQKDTLLKESHFEVEKLDEN